MWITFFLSYFQVIFVLTCPTVLYPLGCRFDSGRTIKAGQRFARIRNDSQLKPEPESRWGQWSTCQRPTCHVEVYSSHWGQLLVTLRPTCHMEANFNLTAQVNSLNIYCQLAIRCLRQLLARPPAVSSLRSPSPLPNHSNMQNVPDLQ